MGTEYYLTGLIWLSMNSNLVPSWFFLSWKLGNKRLFLLFSTWLSKLSKRTEFFFCNSSLLDHCRLRKGSRYIEVFYHSYKEEEKKQRKKFYICVISLSLGLYRSICFAFPKHQKVTWQLGLDLGCPRAGPHIRPLENLRSP